MAILGLTTACCGCALCSSIMMIFTALFMLGIYPLCSEEFAATVAAKEKYDSSWSAAKVFKTDPLLNTGNTDDYGLDACLKPYQTCLQIVIFLIPLGLAIWAVESCTGCSYADAALMANVERAIEADRKSKKEN